MIRNVKKIVVFDLGNVLIDINVNGDEFLQKIALYQKDKTKKLYFDLVKDINILFNCGSISQNDFYNRVRETLKLDILFENFSTIWKSIFSENKVLLPYARSLKSKYPNTLIILASNTDEIHYPYIKEVYNIDFIDYEFLSYREKIVKPDLLFFKKLIDKYKLSDYIKEDNAIFVDDLQENVLAAEKTGFVTIQNTNSFETKDKLEVFLNR